MMTKHCRSTNPKGGASIRPTGNKLLHGALRATSWPPGGGWATTKHGATTPWGSSSKERRCGGAASRRARAAARRAHAWRRPWRWRSAGAHGFCADAEGTNGHAVAFDARSSDILGLRVLRSRGDHSEAWAVDLRPALRSDRWGSRTSACYICLAVSSVARRCCRAGCCRCGWRAGRHWRAGPYACALLLEPLTESLTLVHTILPPPFEPRVRRKAAIAASQWRFH
mmetsp:Transcript_93366/g.162200  ORF Transcript_93366/g.162200 Transcript_93366/m.162200 type:complete len:226 (-) Transcript_93366:1043-1720(-)